MEPEFHIIPLASSDAAADEAFINEIQEHSLRYKSFNKNEIKYLYTTLIDNCIYFLETTYESLYATSYTFDHQEFHVFANEIIRKARVSIPLLYSVMYYIKRFRAAVRKNPKVILGLNQGVSIKEPKDLYKIFATAAVLSLKFFNDRVILNHEWTKFLNITVEEVNLCERQFFKLIDYNLNLSGKNYYVFINDYLNKFNNNTTLPSKPSIPNLKTGSLPVFGTSFEGEQPPVITINDRTSSKFNALLCQPNVSGNGANAFLSVTPTPSICSQCSPYTTTVTGNGDKPLTPNDVFMDNQQQFDPMNVESSSPQKQHFDFINYSSDISRNDTQRTLCGDNFKMSTRNINSPDMSDGISRNDTTRTLCNDNVFVRRESPIMEIGDIARNDTQRTLCNEPNGFNLNINPTDVTYSSYYPLNSPNDGVKKQVYYSEYHPSEDKILREHLNNTNVPLNKLLHNIHHYQMKNTQQQVINQYSSNEETTSTNVE